MIAPSRSSAPSSPPASPRKAAHTLGLFIGNQQNTNQNDEEDPSEIQAYDGSEQPSSVLDIGTQQKPVNPSFQEEQRRASERQKQFSGTNPNTLQNGQDGTSFLSDSPSQGRQQKSTEHHPSSRLSRLISANNLAALNDGKKEQQGVLTTAKNAQETVTEIKDLFQRFRRISEFFTGAGAPVAFVEQHILVANRMLLNGAIQLPDCGGRPPGAYDRNPNLRKIDRIDLFIAILMDIGLVILALLAIVAFLIEALPFIIAAFGLSFAVEQLGVNGSELFRLLAN